MRNISSLLLKNFLNKSYLSLGLLFFFYLRNILNTKFRMTRVIMAFVKYRLNKVLNIKEKGDTEILVANFRIVLQMNLNSFQCCIVVVSSSSSLLF